MLRLFVLLLLATVACYAPTPPTGAPCVADSDCPSPQICQPNTNTCEASCIGCDGGPADITGDTAAADCWATWLAGTIDFATPTRVDPLHSDAANTTNSSLSPDNLTIYVERSSDQMFATRPTLESPFGPPQLVAELQTAAGDSRITTTADNKLAVFASSRTGTLGNLDLWQATRTSPDQDFTGVTAAPFAAINDASAQFDPEITPDGLHLYWAPPIAGQQVIQHASRAATSEAFGNLSTLAIAAGTLTDLFDPSISSDQRVLLFAGQIGAGTPDLFYVTRTDPDSAFSAPQPIPNVNSEMYEGDSDVSADGCTVFFASNRDGIIDIYSAVARR